MITPPYNPNTNQIANGNFAAIDANFNDAKVILLGGPWEGTASYRTGTLDAPEKIIESSLQIDVFDVTFPEINTAGKIYYDSTYFNCIKDLAIETRQLYDDYINLQSTGVSEGVLDHIETINENCEIMNDLIQAQADRALKLNKVVGLIGGDHSVSYGQIKAIGDHFENFSILHIDAHHDLRIGFQGLQYSHAAVLANAINDVSQIDQLTSIGIRDNCIEEFEFAAKHDKISTFYDEEISKQLLSGNSNWGEIVNQIIQTLSQNVYVTLDIDGLSIENTPFTGTPVPGGISYHQVRYLLNQLGKERKIIGFDVVESGSAQLDTIVSMRLVYKLCVASIASQNN